jgi:hypothetical protein
MSHNAPKIERTGTHHRSRGEKFIQDSDVQRSIRWRSFVVKVMGALSEVKSFTEMACRLPGEPLFSQHL